MKTSILNSLILIAVTSVVSFAGDYKAGKEKTISEPVYDNLYIAGSTIAIEAPIHGDLTVGGSFIIVNDTIYEDLIAAGSDITINGYLNDDAKIAGSIIKIQKSINGDLIVFGATVRIDKDVTIAGDLVVFGGYIVNNGTVMGDVKIRGGRVVFNGEVVGQSDIKSEELSIGAVMRGSSVLAAEELTLESGAQFENDVKYWTEEGEIDFGSYISNGQALFDEDLEFYENEIDWKHLGLGIITFWILYTLSVLLVITLLVLLFQKIFSKAGDQINREFVKNFGFGALYFIGVPVVTLFFFATIIGIPIAIVLLHIFLFSLFFAYSLTSVMLANGIGLKYKKKWNKWQLIGVAALTFLILKLITFIPLIGILAVIIIIGIAFGALIVSLFPKKLKHSM